MKNEVLNKLLLLFKKYSSKSKPNADTQMCLFWSIKSPPDVLEGTKQLEEIETEFDIEITEDKAVEMYDMNLLDASEYIQELITAQ